MLLITPEEREWLEPRWRETRRNLIAVLRRRLDGVIAEIAETSAISDAAWSGFVRTVADDLERLRATAGPRRSVMFALCMTLMGECLPLRRALESGLAGLSGPFEGLIWTLAKRGLGTMRHSFTSDSAHRAQTWARLDKISRTTHAGEIAAGHVRDGSGRCYRAHFEAVASQVRADRPDDRNLPRTVDTVEAYFLEFCADCQQAFDPDMTPKADPARPELGWSSVEPDDLSLLPGAEAAAAALRECLEDLPVNPRREVEVAYRLGDVVEMSIVAYCERVGLDRHRFNRRVKEGRRLLLHCLEGKGVEGSA